MKKKYTVSKKDKKDWIDFTKRIGEITSKEINFFQKSTEKKKIKKLDLHGLSLIEANQIVTKFINDAFYNGYRKILIVTGKGLHSNTYNNPYISDKLSVLRYSVPEYIKNNENLSNKIIKMSQADIKDGGEGAIYILLKNNEKSKV